MTSPPGEPRSSSGSHRRSRIFFQSAAYPELSSKVRPDSRGLTFTTSPFGLDLRVYTSGPCARGHTLSPALPCVGADDRLRYRTYATPGAIVDVLLPEGRRVKVVVRPDQIVATVNVRMATCDSAFPASVQDVLHEAAAFDFYILPPTLSGDLDFARRTRLASCSTASRIVVSECQHRGIDARMAYGLVLAPPLGTLHEWAEIRMGDTWAPADPSCSPSSVDSPGSMSSRWPCTYSPSALLLRLADCETPIVGAAGEPVNTSFMVSVASKERTARAVDCAG